VFLELRAFLDYQRREEELSYWRSLSQFEVDFLLGDRIGIEVKGKDRVGPRDYRGLLALREDVALRRMIVVCSEKKRRRTDEGVEVLPVAEFFQDLWAGEILV
jgi:predicted AAA+ superfamily ATPase